VSFFIASTKAVIFNRSDIWSYYNFTVSATAFFT
jgi:hypothetical protein